MIRYNEDNHHLEVGVMDHAATKTWSNLCFTSHEDLQNRLTLMRKLADSCTDSFLKESMTTTLVTLDLAEDLYRMIEGKERMAFSDRFLGMWPNL